MKKAITIKKFTYIIAIILLIVLLGLSISQLVLTNQEPKNYLTQDKINLQDIEYKENPQKDNNDNKVEKEETEYEKALKYFSEDINLDSYRNKYNNPEIVARLEIPNLFNILIVQSKDNKYYLNKSIERKKDVKGTEFMDYRVKPTSKQVNIYGHNSRTYDIPFRKLEKFLDEDFFNKTPYILLQHDGGTRIYKIFSIKETADNEHMYVTSTKENHKEHIEILKSNSIYNRNVMYDENSNIITIQTCSYNGDKLYYVISAIEVTK